MDIQGILGDGSVRDGHGGCKQTLDFMLDREGSPGIRNAMKMNERYAMKLCKCTLQ